MKHPAVKFFKPNMQSSEYQLITKMARRLACID